MKYEDDIPASPEEIAYHEKMHKLYRTLSRAMAGQPDRMPATFARIVANRKWVAPPWPDVNEDEAA